MKKLILNLPVIRTAIVSIIVIEFGIVGNNFGIQIE